MDHKPIVKSKIHVKNFTMKKIPFLFFVFFVVFSCSKEESNPLKKKNDRLSFKNSQDFNNTYLLLAKKSSINELNFWAQSKNHSTLLYSTDSTIENYSDVLKTILNKDYEYEQGDSIIYFHDSNLYAFSKKEEANLEVLKKCLKVSERIGKITIIKYSVSKNSDGRLKTIELGANSLDARNQHEFTQEYYQPCGGTLKKYGSGNLRKYVHEIFSETKQYGSRFDSYLNLRVKLAYKSNGSWRPAGEQRYINVNVTGTAYCNVQIGIYPPPPNFHDGDIAPINITEDCYSGDRTINISYCSDFFGETPHWDVSLTGSIYQKVKGDYNSNAWTNSGTLW